MATAVNALDLIDQQIAKAAEPRPAGNKRPIFLFLKPGHKALIRPLTDLSGCVVLSKHNKYAEDPNLRVNAICATENGDECKFCAEAASDKKLNASIHFYLPVYVYKVTDDAGNVVMYKEKDEAGNETEKPVAGIRVLELSGFGKMGDVLKWFRGFMREAEQDYEPGMTQCDFTFEQTGQGQGKTFSVRSKQPKPMADHIAAKIPTQERLRERILEALPPVVAGATSPAKLQVVKSTATTEEPATDEIPEF